MAHIKIRICQNGLVYAETRGIKGKICVDYGKVIEQLTDAQILEREFTEEYYQEDYLETSLRRERMELNVKDRDSNK